jgi:hypothetical protein
MYSLKPPTDQDRPRVKRAREESIAPFWVHAVVACLDGKFIEQTLYATDALATAGLCKAILVQIEERGLLDSYAHAKRVFPGMFDQPDFEDAVANAFTVKEHLRGDIDKLRDMLGKISKVVCTVARIRVEVK